MLLLFVEARETHISSMNLRTFSEISGRVESTHKLRGNFVYARTNRQPFFDTHRSGTKPR